MNLKISLSSATVASLAFVHAEPAAVNARTHCWAQYGSGAHA
jgi:hypothetical protein